TMVYREIGIPDGTEAFTLSWKQRVSDFQRGSQSWFDIRIMMEFLDGDRKKVTPNPPTPTTSKNTKGWEEKSVTFEVPNTATLLKFMPTLFRVESGTWDLDDVVLRPVPKPKS
ncbi:MAG: glycoside hydrolase family 5 protein, partial [Kiritimatiellae bacterium]|nr:glycoside hydrolase family 5 protein [Kiritimatiellia bacterium]